MPNTILDALSGKPFIFTPPAAAPGAMVYHSYEECFTTREAVNDRFRPTLTTIVQGTLCTIHKDLSQGKEGWTQDRALVVVAWAPPLNALCLRNYPRGIFTDAVDYVPDHTFSRREPQADDGTGPSPIKQAYAMCQGCFDRGWHREETDISGIAFGLDPSALPELPPPRPPASKDDMRACLKQPEAAQKAEPSQSE